MKIDMGEFREIFPVTNGELTITGYQFDCDSNCIFFCINNVLYENEGAKAKFGKQLKDLFPSQYYEVISKMEKHEKDIAKLMWKDESFN